MSAIRPPAVPLVTVDPYFSVWSFADRLTDDHTRHWTGQRHAMTGLIRIDGTVRRFAGLVEPSAERYYPEPPAMEQTGLKVTPLSTEYAFEAGGVGLNVRFTSPLLLNDLDILSRPTSYISFETVALDGKEHDVQLYFDVTGEWCVDRPDQAVLGERVNEDGIISLKLGHEKQETVNRPGDDHRIDWGYLYLNAKESDGTTAYTGTAALRKAFVRNEELKETDLSASPSVVRDVHPVLALTLDLGSVGSTSAERLIVLAYDDIDAMEYFGDKLQAYWKRSGKTIQQAISESFSGCESVLERCAEFDKQILTEGERSGGVRYGDLLSLSYRQAIAAHKLVSDTEGDLLFLSKECYSNGCLATVDVSYPSIPLFLLYNPALVEAMIRPIVKYARSGDWPFDFAPHDIGQYPLGNGQVYGENKLEYQMPVEESGNMLVMAATTCLAGGNREYILEQMDLWEAWVRYLVEYGLDPENQLCTDDFAGHLARNANLSVKAVMGVASFSILKRLQGDDAEAERYRSIAKDMADKWSELAADGDHTKLAFGQDGTWSLKYNLIWDVLYGTELFDPEIFRSEVSWYKQRRNAYGTPLDSRADYTKADWLVWAASLAEDQADFAAIVSPLWDMLNETQDRVPFSDWTDTKTARQIGFQHRSVLGGIFMKLLKDRGSMSL
ncbi:DUF4965 domain-containing protein [Saccharibacillus sp. CPCC 101409]|uniref:glutaminase family protein n=1 Tax=Saccharibacillus sp. CPCC 101409 TaxID=3058041 RepID=UPI002672637B|nr:glutaminase family protein [Saccharibacillus sp. CPCC 101409]MDO3413370.1 DUF4965 domain-containing protein [Saccharibacillus sp. CPCC 101409]